MGREQNTTRSLAIYLGVAALLLAIVVGWQIIDHRTATQTGSCPPRAISADDISQLNQDLGSSVTVDGSVVLTHYAPTEEGQPTFLDFHDPYQGYFEVVIWVENRSAFNQPPEDYYLNKKVCVTGTLSYYAGPQIRVTSPNQIVVVGS